MKSKESNQQGQLKGEYLKWFQNREEEYQRFLSKMGTDIRFDKGIEDLMMRFNKIHPQFLIYRACSGYIHKDKKLVSFMNPYIRVTNSPVGYGLVLSPTIEEIEAYHKVLEIIQGLEDQVNFHFDDKAVKIQIEYPEGSYEMEGNMMSEIMFSVKILKPELGVELLKVLWASFERILDYFDLKGEKFLFDAKKFYPPLEIITLRQKIKKTLPKEFKIDPGEYAMAA